MAARAQPTTCTGAPVVDDRTVYDSADVSELPTLRAFPRLLYPSRLMSEGVNGSVLLSLIVLADGQVLPDSIRVVQATNDGFIPNSLAFAKGLLYWPACREGRPVAARTHQLVTYNVIRH